MVNLRQLRYLIGIIDAGSFSRAAVALRIAQPALSEQILNLEKELGTELLLRSPRGVQPTRAGAIVCRSARAILNELVHLRTASRATAGLAGNVSLGLTSSVSDTFTAPIVSAVLATHPGIRINMVDGPGHVHHDSLMRGTLDIAVLHEHAESTGLRRRPLYRQQLFLVQRSVDGTDPCGTIRMADLASRNLVLPAMPNPSRAVIEAALLPLGTRPRVVAEANTKGGPALPGGGWDRRDGALLGRAGQPGILLVPHRRSRDLP